MITLIAAIGLNRELGVNNQLLEFIPKDMKRFREITSNNVIVMGRKTYESIGHTLPNRVNVILTSDKSYKVIGAFVFHSIEDILNHYMNQDLIIIGGGNVYSQFLRYADKLQLTIIDNKYPKADTFFPAINDEWKVVSSVKNTDYKYDYYFVDYALQCKLNNIQ